MKQYLKIKMYDPGITPQDGQNEEMPVEKPKSRLFEEFTPEEAEKHPAPKEWVERYLDDRFNHYMSFGEYFAMKDWTGKTRYFVKRDPLICQSCGHLKECHVYVYDVKGYVIDERFAGCHIMINENGYMGDVMEFRNCEKGCRGFE